MFMPNLRNRKTKQIEPEIDVKAAKNQEVSRFTESEMQFDPSDEESEVKVAKINDDDDDEEDEELDQVVELHTKPPI